MVVLVLVQVISPSPGPRQRARPGPVFPAFPRSGCKGQGQGQGPSSGRLADQPWNAANRGRRRDELTPHPPSLIRIWTKSGLTAHTPTLHEIPKYTR